MVGSIILCQCFLSQKTLKIANSGSVQFSYIIHLLLFKFTSSSITRHRCPPIFKNPHINCSLRSWLNWWLLKLNNNLQTKWDTNNANR